MSIPDDPHHRVILRRLKDIGQPIELVPAIIRIEAGKLSDKVPISISSWVEGEFQCYKIDLPRGLIVRPVDWRQFAYDHQKVCELLGNCVLDNVQELALFTPWSDALKESLESCLMSALGDFSSIFDIKSVQCEYEAGYIVTAVEGEHKNGEHRIYCFPFQSLY